ncbi:MAG: asparagine synthase (glutamine-hydrolyzing) [Deltaproteobacteria bacterium]|nr:asparagine synthase (glutamine-hydrolyzing) [Deltaproteobacteria bacterium]
MCGITGYWNFAVAEGKDDLVRRVALMTQTLIRRGPDSGGVWAQPEAGFALGHRRLSIRDLSPLGHQPMISPDGRFALSYNGEIYNTEEIAAKLAARGVRPRGTSDSEILLLACAELGVDETLPLLLGMFAFALWDAEERRLTLARDRFGVKPLYWLHEGGRFCFASELKALRTLEDWHPDIDRDALALLLRYGYIPAPHAIWRGTRKLPAACRLDVSAGGTVQTRPYWSALDAACAGLDNPFSSTEADESEIVTGLDALLTDAVKRRMVADVPLGVFLSGGIDSSVVTALMQKCSDKPVRTFSIGFEEEAYNEAHFAAAVAAYLGTQHTEVYLRPQDAQELIPQLPTIYDEPFADASQIPTSLLSRITRRHVTTVLSGDGGDELFAGYGRYAACLANMPDFPPKTLGKAALASFIRALSPSGWDRLAALLPKSARPRNAGARLRNYADLFLHGDPQTYYHRYYMMYWWHPDTVLLSGDAPATEADDKSLPLRLREPLSIMQYLDTRLYLAEDILTKVDRAGMHHSLETRVPLLDARVFSYAWRIPLHMRIRDGTGKTMLRRVLHRYVPQSLVERPKMGFGIPIGRWLTTSLRAWAEDLLSPDVLRNQGFFRPEPVRYAWLRHTSGAGNWEYLLWIVLMFQAWLAAPQRERSNDDGLPRVDVRDERNPDPSEYMELWR